MPCDIRTPGVDGRELLARLAVDHPGLQSRLIFMTGGTYTDAAGAFLASVKNCCLEKPVPLDRLRRKIHESPRG